MFIKTLTYMAFLGKLSCITSTLKAVLVNRVTHLITMTLLTLG